MKSYLSTHLTVALIALIGAFALIGSVSYVRFVEHEIESSLNDTLARQQETIATLASLTDRNAADEVTERIIADCSQRERFETLLMELNTLSRKELLEAQQLFESCGRFFVARKDLMVSRLEQEYVSFEITLNHIKIIRDITPEEKKWQRWGEVIHHERERSELLEKQFVLQREIIALLLRGDQGARSTVLEQVRAAQEIGESLMVLDKQIDEITSAIK